MRIIRHASVRSRRHRPRICPPRSGNGSTGFPEQEVTSTSWLYKPQPLEEGAQLLMMGRVGEALPHEPVSWTYRHAGGGRVFYTSLGHQDDFACEVFRRLLASSIYWAADQEPPATLADSPPRP